MSEINTWPGWECVRLLGAGSFGKVYEIQKIENGRAYKSALKVITIPQNDAEIEKSLKSIVILVDTREKKWGLIQVVLDSGQEV